MEHLNLITVNESAETVLHASGADIQICISGQSFVTGNEAFKKAAEVQRCVAALKECGITEDEISLQNVTTQVDSGILAKSSSASYYLAVRCTSLDRLGPTLAAIASQKNSRLVELLWTFDNLEGKQGDLLREAVRKAKSTAQSIADAMGTSCSAAYRLSYEFSGINRHAFHGEVSAYAGMKRAKAAAPLRELNLEHQTKLSAKGFFAEFSGCSLVGSVFASF